MKTFRKGSVSVLFNEPKLLKCWLDFGRDALHIVSVLFNEPKLLKCLAPVGNVSV